MKTTERRYKYWITRFVLIYAIFHMSFTDSKNKNCITLKEKLYSIIDTVPGTVGIAFISDFDTVTVNNGVHFPMMSVFKLHQSLAVVHTLNNIGASIDSVIHVTDSEIDSETWSPMLKKYREPDFDISIRDLIKYALTVSDNNASNLLFKRIVSPTATDTFIRSIANDTTFKIKYSEDEMKKNHALAYLNYTSPLSAASLIKQVFESPLIMSSSIDSIRKDLATVTTGLDRLGSIIPQYPNLFFAHKTGSGYRNYIGELAAHNDVGYFRLPDNRTYAIAVFIRDYSGTETEASAVISHIAQTVYNYQLNQ